jgi:uncharacterized Zn-finger protein
MCDFPNCERKFNAQSNLKNHKNRHEAKEIFKCSYDGCDKKYKFHIRLEIHSRIHVNFYVFLYYIDGGKAFSM